MNWNEINRRCKQFAGTIKDKWAQVPDDERSPAVVDTITLAPLWFVPVSKWVSKARTAVALNGKGEILLFHDKKIAFARGQGHWGYFAPETIVTPLASKAPVKVTISEVRDAVCRISPDALIGGSNGCIGVSREDVNPIDADIASEGVVPSSSPGARISSLRKILRHTSSVCGIAPALRQEIMALNDATVLTLDGEILAARATLLIKHGGVGNGCHSAAKASCESALRIKITNDGCLQVFAFETEGPFISFV